jgi:hypothetical protein
MAQPSSIANVLLPMERRAELSAADLSDQRLRPRRSPKRLVWGVVVSLAIHITITSLLPREDITLDMGATPPPLRVTVTPATPAPPVPVQQEEPPRRVIAADKSSSAMPKVYVPPELPEPLPPTRALPAPTAPPMDFASALEARRAARDAQEAAYAQQNAVARNGERELTRAEKAEAAYKRNTSGLGSDGDGTSGIFQIRAKGTRYGTFSFRGWTNDRSNSRYQLIEVDAGIGGDVELAMVRRMIDLIRTHYQGDFNWESHRLNRVVKLSARPADTASLEAFLMREFFG